MNRNKIRIKSCIFCNYLKGGTFSVKINKPIYSYPNMEAGVPEANLVRTRLLKLYFNHIPQIPGPS